MAAGIDARSLLRAMAENPDAFPAVQADIGDFARKAMVKQLKDKSTTVDVLKALFHAAGEQTVSIVLDGFSANEVAGLVKKIDAHSPYAKAGEDVAGARRHVLALGGGQAAPSEKPEKPAKTPKAKAPAAKSKIGAVLGSKVHDGGAPKPKARAKKPA